MEAMEASSKSPVGAVYINKNLELILKPTTPLASSLVKESSSLSLSSSIVTTPSKPSPCKSDSTQHSQHTQHNYSDCTQHIHSQSTLSGQQLLPNQESDEYVV